MKLSFKVVITIMTASILILLGINLLTSYLSYSKLNVIANSSRESLNIAQKVGMLEKEFGLMIQDWKNTLLRGANPDDFKKHSAQMDEAIEKQKEIAKALIEITAKEHHQYLNDFLEKLANLEVKYKEARTNFLNQTVFEPASADKAVKGIDRGVLEVVKTLSTELAKQSEETQAELIAEFRSTIIYTSVASLVFSIIALSLIGLNINKTMARTNELTASLYQDAIRVAKAAAEISSYSGSLSQATTEQAASLEETASSLEEISAMIAKTTDSANTSAQSSVESQSKAEEGRQAVENMLVSIEEISQSNNDIMTQVNHSNQQMAEIVRVIQEIGEKTKVINEIVFQTKLLSFNASVEAARAGEHGKGFAVVAEEVGSLAQMSGNAAKQISDMLNSSTTKVEGIVNETKAKVELLISQGRSKVEAGTVTAKQCADLLNEITENVTKVSGLAKDISGASNEQAQGVSEINKAMGQLDTVTQQNATISSETATAVASLSSQAESLRSAVEELVLTLGMGTTTQAEKSNKNLLSLASKKAEAKSNVIKLASKGNKKTESTKAEKIQTEDMAPGRDHDGFEG